MREADDVEIRVLGSLLEKQRLTPDVYPLTLNALRAACNQATSREPVVDYDDATIRAALERLASKRFTRLASGAGSRAPKYRHLLAETLGLSDAELALLALLMLRGPQTAAELRRRSERLHAFATAEAVTATLDALAGKRLAVLLERRPGEKEARYAQLLGAAAERPAGTPPAAPAAPVAVAVAPEPPAAVDGDLAARVARLEAEVAELRAALHELRR
jgi:uncharacterized protein YceH (UPF0502 family)